MSITKSNPAKQAATNAVVDLIDAGSGAGKLKIYDDVTLLATLTLSDPAFGDANTSGVATAAAIAGVEATGAGTADGFELTDSNDNVVISGTAGQEHAITGGNQGNKEITVAADLSGVLSPGSIVEITDATGNDGVYTVASVSYSDPTSTITLVEALASATLDGNFHAYDQTLDNPSIAVSQNVSVSSITYNDR